MVPSIPKGDNGGSPSYKNEEREDPEDPSKDSKGNSESPSAESKLPLASEGSESHSSDDKLLSNSKVWHLVYPDKAAYLLPMDFFEKQRIACTETLMHRSWQLFTLHFVALHLVSLYNIFKYSSNLRQAV